MKTKGCIRIPSMTVFLFFLVLGQNAFCLSITGTANIGMKAEFGFIDLFFEADDPDITLVQATYNFTNQPDVALFEGSTPSITDSNEVLFNFFPESELGETIGESTSVFGFTADGFLSRLLLDIGGLQFVNLEGGLPSGEDYAGQALNIVFSNDIIILATFVANGLYSATAEFEFSDSEPPAPIPEPATILLISTGVIGMGLFGKKKLRKPIKS